MFYGKWTFPPYHFFHFNVVQGLAEFYGKNRVDYYFTEGLPLLLTTTLPFTVIGVWDSCQSRDRSTNTPAKATTSNKSDDNRKVGSISVQHSAITRFQQDQILFVLTLASGGVILAFSALSHKEVRFLYPLHAPLTVLAASPFAKTFSSILLSNGSSKHGSATTKTISSSTTNRHFSLYALLTLLLTANLTIAYYTTQIHQRGIIDVLTYLRATHAHHVATYDPDPIRRTSGSFAVNEQLNPVARGEVPFASGKWKATYKEGPKPTITGPRTEVFFLMPCHSTPWRSHLLSEGIRARALTCEPPLDLAPAERERYVDEADVFYEDPVGWIERDGWFGENKKAYVVVFEALLGMETSRREGRAGTVSEWLGEQGWKEVWRGFNTHWHDDSRRVGDVVVLRKEMRK